MLKNFTLWEAIKIGGPVMYLLILCSIVSIAVIVDRLVYYYKKSRIQRNEFMQVIREYVTKGDLKRAIAVCAEANSPFAAVTAAGLAAADQDDKEIAAALERQTIIEATELERRIGIIGTIGGTAVYIGLFGTVWGIIHTFQDIAKAGSGGIDVVIRGVAEALVATAAGLFVAIPAVVAYNYCIKTIAGFVTDMELCASEISGLIRSGKK